MPESPKRSSTQRASGHRKNRNSSNSRSTSRNPPSGQRLSDEEYARQLQREYVRENKRMNPQQQQPKNLYPPPLRTSSTADSSYAPAQNPDHRSPTNAHSPQRASRSSDHSAADLEYARRVEQQMRDEDVARRVMQEERDAQAARQLSNNAAPVARGVVVGGSSSSRPQQHGRSPRNGGRSSHHGHARSSAHAGRPARGPQNQTQQVRHTQAVQSYHHQSSGNCCCKAINKFVSFAICMAVLIICGAVIYVVYTGKDVDIPGTDITVGDITDVFMQDPWEYGPGANQTQTFWRTRGREGLSLKVYNAMDPAWYPFFDKAIYDWENGSPDALTLTTQTIEANPSCEAINGAMRVCNGDYGNTGWKGINEVLIQGNGQISVSVAKMNEFYLKPGDDAAWQYTVCHEIGHGFGLNHADENFNNVDLGTCMDYTNRPRNNMSPNTDSYKILADLYGTVGGTTEAQSRTTSIEALKKQEQLGQRQQSLNAGGGRKLRGNKAFVSYTEDPSQFRLLSRRENLEMHERDLGNGYRIVAHLLLAEDAADVIQEGDYAPELQLSPEILEAIQAEDEEETR